MVIWTGHFHFDRPFGQAISILPRHLTGHFGKMAWQNEMTVISFHHAILPKWPVKWCVKMKWLSFHFATPFWHMGKKAFWLFQALGGVKMKWLSFHFDRSFCWKSHNAFPHPPPSMENGHAATMATGRTKCIHVSKALLRVFPAVLRDSWWIPVALGYAVESPGNQCNP